MHSRVNAWNTSYVKSESLAITSFANGPFRLNSPAALAACVRIAEDLTKKRLIERLRSITI